MVAIINEKTLSEQFLELNILIRKLRERLEVIEENQHMIMQDMKKHVQTFEAHDEPIMEGKR